jgi:ParB family chromosome partitioning protein
LLFQHRFKEPFLITEIPIKDIHLYPDRFYRKTLGDLDKLAESMSAPNGQLQSIWIDENNNLIFGFRRLQAAKRLGWPTIRAIRVDLADPLAAIRDENECRADLTPSERVELGKMIEAAEAAKARERMTLGKNLAKGTDATRSAEKAAEAVGWSRPTYEAAKKVMQHGTEELKRALDEGKVSASDAAKVAKQSPGEQDAAVEAVRSGRARTATEAVDENGKAEIFPELQAKLDQGQISPKLAPDIKKLSLSKQEQLLNLIAEGKNPRPALGMVQASAGHPTKSGKPIFDDRQVTDAFGKLIRILNSRKDAKGTHPEHQNCLDHIDKALCAWKRWQKETT